MHRIHDQIELAYDKLFETHPANCLRQEISCAHRKSFEMVESGLCDRKINMSKHLYVEFTFEKNQIQSTIRVI